jgi:hypothetical protein
MARESGPRAASLADPLVARRPLRRDRRAGMSSGLLVVKQEVAQDCSRRRSARVPLAMRLGHPRVLPRGRPRGSGFHQSGTLSLAPAPPQNQHWRGRRSRARERLPSSNAAVSRETASWQAWPLGCMESGRLRVIGATSRHAPDVGWTRRRVQYSRRTNQRGGRLVARRVGVGEDDG